MESQPAIWKKAGPEDHDFIREASQEFAIFGPYTEIIESWLRDSWVETWVYEDKKGFLMLGPFFPIFFRSVLDVMVIYVSPAWRRRGVGKTMLEFACTRASRKGYRFLRAHVGCENHPALELFKKAGFKIKKRIEDYYPSGLAAFEFLKEVKNSER